MDSSKTECLQHCSNGKDGEHHLASTVQSKALQRAILTGQQQQFTFRQHFTITYTCNNSMALWLQL